MCQCGECRVLLLVSMSASASSEAASAVPPPAIAGAADGSRAADGANNVAPAGVEASLAGEQPAALNAGRENRTPSKRAQPSDPDELTP